jgi:5-methylcytosine-specific restriction endonuclease McrA
MRRDKYSCKKCGWDYSIWNPSDPRFLEPHHILHHAQGGSSELENLITYCNVCHDEIHRVDKNR